MALQLNLEDSPDEELPLIAQRALSLIAKIQAHAGELTELLALLKEKKAARAKKDLDEYGEPTWRFAIKVKIPFDIKLTRYFREYYLAQGLPAADLKDQWEGFVNCYNKNHKKWGDWSRVWFDWCRREKKRRAAEPRQVRSSKTLREL